MSLFYRLVVGLWSLSSASLALSSSTSRRTFLTAITTASTTIPTMAASATADCYTDCFQNCKLIAPKDPAYCQDTCREYCAQDDRKDGLSGSVDASAGEVGILGGTFGTGTVVKGQDKPPSLNLPGLDFTKGSGRQLIGY